MMKLKMIISLTLIVLMLASMIVSCSNNDNTNQGATTTVGSDFDEEDTAEVTTAKLESGLESNVDYGGYKFNIYIHGAHGINDFEGEEYTGEVINDAQYERTLKVEEMCNVDIQYILSSESDNRRGHNIIGNTVAAGSNDYDMAIMSGYSCSSAVTAGYLMNLNEIDNLDLSQPWWDQYANEDFAFGDKLFMTTGDISTADNAATFCVYFNKKLAVDYNLPNFYDLVDNMGWTIENLGVFMSDIWSDLDGDGVHDNDPDDLYGLYIWDDIMMGIINAAGIKCCEVNSSGQIELTLYSEKFISAFDKFADVVYNKEVSCAYQRNGYAEDYGQIAFRDDRALFFMAHLGHVTSLRDMDTDFGILPLPLFDDGQDRYYNSIASWNSAFITVPRNAMNDEEFARTGHIIQALAYESLYALTPAYYEITLKGKAARDEESSAMLDLIFSTRTYDYGWYFEIGTYNEAIMNLLRNYSTDVSSMYEKTQKSAQTLIDKINTAIDELY